MIIIVHNNKHVIRVFDKFSNFEISFGSEAIIKELYKLAESRQDSVLIWCHEDLLAYIDYNYIHGAFYLKNLMMSFSHQDFMKPQIGYVEDSPFLKVNKQVKYPTWLMSSMVGAIHASELLKYIDIVNDSNFDLALNSISKLGMSNGLFCYSDPKLLTNVNWSNITIKQSSVFELFKFVKRHYKWVWTFLLFFNFLVFEKRFLSLALLKSWFYKPSQINFTHELAFVNDNLTEITNNLPSIDVTIPTIGRKDYLYDVLKDLSAQTHLPQHVIIIEQNSDVNSKSDLDYLINDYWPFEIIHEFIHQTGACNARNLALSKIKSEFVFLCDDDNRFTKNLLKQSLSFMKLYSFGGLLTSYLQKGEQKNYNTISQTSIFGSGNSIIESSSINKILFDNNYEYCYGEDTDFGYQLRNMGIDIVYNPLFVITHLKAPMGGFRIKQKLLWEYEKIQPSPSPSIMYLKMQHQTKYQLLGYKTILFLKKHKKKSIFHLVYNLRCFIIKWQLSEKWAKSLINGND